MKELKNKNEFSEWLSENYGFEDGFITEIKEEEMNGVKIVRFRLGYITETKLIGGTLEKYKEYEIIAFQVSKWTKSEKTDYYPENCIEDIEEIIESEDISFKVNIPSLVEIECKKIIIEEEKVISRICKPWISEREVFIKLDISKIPEPKEWIELFADEEIEVVWRYYCGEKRESEKVSYPDYSGWFIQEEEKLKIDKGGIYFKFLGIRNNKVEICLEKYSENIEEIWKMLFKKMCKKYKFQINSGNCTFNNYEWEDYILNNKIPKRYIVEENI